MSRVTCEHCGNAFFPEAGTSCDDCPTCGRTWFAPKVASKKCNCDMRTSILGDGCEVCNPKLAQELSAPSADEVREAEARSRLAHYCGSYHFADPLVAEDLRALLSSHADQAEELVALHQEAVCLSYKRADFLCQLWPRLDKYEADHAAQARRIGELEESSKKAWEACHAMSSDISRANQDRDKWRECAVYLDYRGADYCVAIHKELDALQADNKTHRGQMTKLLKAWKARAERAEAAFEEQAVQLRAEESASAKLKNHMAALEEVLGRVAKYPHDATRWLEDVEAALRGAEAK